MELKDILYKGAEEQEYPDFISLSDNPISNWFDVDKIVPEINKNSYKCDMSILVLVKDEFGNVTSGNRSVSSGKWVFNAKTFGKVISWTYIPN